MEHLLEPGTVAKIRIPCYRQRPDDDGKIATVDEHAYIFEAIVNGARSETVVNTTALWYLHRQNGHVYNLCHALLDQFYFGRLLHVLGSDVKVADYTTRDDSGHVFLTTSKLGSDILAWNANVQLLDTAKKADLKQRCLANLQQANAILYNLSEFLKSLYATIASPDDYEADPLGRTHFSCALLHQALYHACVRIFDVDVLRDLTLQLKTSLPWLTRKVKREGWCPHTIQKLYAEWNMEDLAYGYALGTVRAGIGRHTHCSEAICLANNTLTDRALGHTNHESCLTVEAPLDEIVALLREDEIPTLRISTDDGYKLSLRACKALSHDGQNGGCRYVAISHVWADGLGTSSANIIAQCQLVRLADRLGRLQENERCGELCIWLDTLCIPVQPQYQDLRNKQINLMHQIYSNAYAVLVMDEDIMQMSQGASVPEIGFRLRMSAWASRLWTYQEGALNARTLIVTATGCIDLDVIVRQLVISDESEDPFQHDQLRNSLWIMLSGLGRGFEGSLARFRPRPLNSEDQSMAEDSGDLIAQLMVHAMCTRATSRQDDEAVVIATSLDLDITSIVAVSGEEKMVALLRCMPIIPSNILFVLGRRLKQPGFQWAPASFLRSNGAMAKSFLQDHVPITMQDIEQGHTTKRPSSTLDPNGGGLRTFNPAIKLKRIFKQTKNHVTLVFELLGTYMYMSGVAVDEHYGDLQATIAQNMRLEEMVRKGKELVLILPIFYPKQTYGFAVMLEVVSSVEGGQTADSAVKARYCMPVTLEMDVSPRERRLNITLAAGKEKTAVTIEAEADSENAEQVRDKSYYKAEWIEPRFWLVD